MDYLDWQSSISLEQVFASGDSFSHPSFVADLGVVYLGLLKQQKSRSALMLLTEAGSTCLTPDGYNLQTKVNEYGGKPYWVIYNSHWPVSGANSGSNSIVFANQSDQCLYQQAIQGGELGKPQRISTRPNAERRFMFTDVCAASESSLLAIVELEKTNDAAHENRMFIAALPENNNDDPKALIHGADFYSNLVIDRAGSKVAWVQWSHPSMPWDDTELWIADLQISVHGTGIANAKRVPVSTNHGGGASVCQLMFANNGRLFFSADYQNSHGCENYWNVHVYDPEANSVSRVTNDELEYGYPHWVYGDHRIVQIDDKQLLTVASSPEGDSLTLINQETLVSEAIFRSDGSIQHLASDLKGNCAALSLAKNGSPRLCQFALSMRQGRHLQQSDIMVSSDTVAEVSLAQSLSYATQDGSRAYGFYYAPHNPKYRALTKTENLPPLIVMVHGGPTARAYGHFDIQKQFWTSRGFALLDVNHRGSTGFGRRFRDDLYGHWGDRDTRDIVDAINHLVEHGLADPNRVCIRGKSAGGYAVLRALTEYPDVFKAGACYYGIGNLVTLAEVTHKFEKYYTDRLIGEEFTADTKDSTQSRYYTCSPINKIDQISSAMIVFQGGLDKVVPPSVAKEVIDKLKHAKLDHEYNEYPDEGHGFRQVSNNIDSWTKELKFYRRILGQ